MPIYGIRASLIVICRDQHALLKRLLESVADERKGITDLEVVISDDGSEDGTREFLEPIAAKGEILYDWHSRLGRGLNRNRGASLASGDILIFIDGDMEPAAGFCRAHLEAHRNQPGAIYFSHVVLAEEARKGPLGEYLGRWWERRMRGLAGTDPLELAGLGSGAFSIGRKAFQSLGGFRQLAASYGSEDADFFSRARKKGMPFRPCPAATAYHHGRVNMRTRCQQKFLDGYTTVHYGLVDGREWGQAWPSLSSPNAFIGDPRFPPEDGSVRFLAEKHAGMTGFFWSRFRSCPVWIWWPESVPFLCRILPSNRRDEWIGTVLFEFKKRGVARAQRGLPLPKGYSQI